MTGRDSLIQARDDDRLEAIHLALTWVPLTHYDSVQKRAEEAVGELIAERDQAIERVKWLRESLKDVLDAAERDRAGFSIESEEWYARRDFARIQIADSEPQGDAP